MAYSWLAPYLAKSKSPFARSDGTYEAGLPNSDWRALMLGGQGAADRFRGNYVFFPNAAAKVAAGDAAAGALAAQHQSPAPRPAAQPAPLSAEQAFQKAKEEANAKTEQRYAETLAGYDARRRDAVDLVSGGGMTDAERNRIQANKLEQESLRMRGLGKGSIADYATQTYQRDMGNISFDKAMQLARLDAQLSGDRLRVMESRNDVPPDPRLFADAMQKIGSGSTAGMTAPDGPPVMAGNPYGTSPSAPPIQPTGDYGTPGGLPADPAAVQQWSKDFNRALSYEKSRDARVVAKQGIQFKPGPTLPPVSMPAVSGPVPSVAPPQLRVPAARPKLTYVDPSKDALGLSYYDQVTRPDWSKVFRRS